jgi:hypothetical protein
MPKKVPANARGIVRPAAIIGTSLPRNAKTTPMTRQIEMSRHFCMSARLARMVLVRSDMTAMSMSAGIQRLSFGRSARTRSAVSTTLAAAALVMVMTTAGRPS